MLRTRLLKVATPLLAVTVVVLPPVKPPGPLAMPTVTFGAVAGDDVAELVHTCTVTAGLIDTPAVAAVGCCETQVVRGGRRDGEAGRGRPAERSVGRGQRVAGAGLVDRQVAERGHAAGGRCVSVPLRVPLPALWPMATVTFDVSLTTRLLYCRAPPP